MGPGRRCACSSARRRASCGRSTARSSTTCVRVQRRRGPRRGPGRGDPGRHHRRLDRAARGVRRRRVARGAARADDARDPRSRDGRGARPPRGRRAGRDDRRRVRATPSSPGRPTSPTRRRSPRSSWRSSAGTRRRTWTSCESDADRVFIDAELTDDARTNLDDAITNGRLPGITIEPVGQLAVAGGDGVTFVGPAGHCHQHRAARGRRDVGRARLGDRRRLPDLRHVRERRRRPGGRDHLRDRHRRRERPGPVDDVPAAGRRRADRVRRGVRARRGPRHRARTAAARRSTSWSRTAGRCSRTTSSRSSPRRGCSTTTPTSRARASGSILAFGAEGDDRRRGRRQLPLLVADAGRDPRRADDRRPLPPRPAAVRASRRSPCSSGLFVLLDGMFFVQSRIAMNDVYTGFFILAAYLLFAWLWIERRRARRVLAAHARDRRAARARARVEVGRGLRHRRARHPRARPLRARADHPHRRPRRSSRALLGWMAMAVPTDSTVSGNLLFPLIMIALTLGGGRRDRVPPDRLVGRRGPARRRWARRRSGILIVLAAIAAGQGARRQVAVGPLLVNPLTLGFALVVAGGLAYAAFQLGGRYGLGPMARTPEPGTRGGVRRAARAGRGGLAAPRAPGSGLPIVWMVACLHRHPARRLRGAVPAVGVHRQPPARRRASRRATPARRSST